MVVLDIGPCSEMLNNEGEEKVDFSLSPQESRYVYPSGSVCTGHQRLGPAVKSSTGPFLLGTSNEPAARKNFKDSTPF